MEKIRNMKKFMLIAVLAVMAFAGTASAQNQSNFEFYTGVQFDRSDFDYRNSTSQAFAFNRSTDSVGADVALTGFVSKYVGLTGDVSATFKGGRNEGSLITALGGITVKARNERFQPFVRVLAGGARQRVASAQLNFDTSDVNFAGLVGGGLDINLERGGRTKVRLIQVDYLRVGAVNSAFFRGGENHIRLGVGLVW